MAKKTMTAPSEEELSNRLLKHLMWRESSPEVSLLWEGYLAALLEWGLIEVQINDRLMAHIPDVGLKELHELAVGAPITPERETEIDEYLASHKAS